eukprot:2224634-Rhodomonas_salina.1
MAPPPAPPHGPHPRLRPRWSRYRGRRGRCGSATALAPTAPPALCCCRAAPQTSPRAAPALSGGAPRAAATAAFGPRSKSPSPPQLR